MALYFETMHPLRLIASVEEIAILVDIGLIMTIHIHTCKKSRFGDQMLNKRALYNSLMCMLFSGNCCSRLHSVIACYLDASFSHVK